MQFLSLHVRGFNAQTTSAEDLTQYFRAFGEVKNLKITPSGAALVSFSDRDVARYVKDQTNGALFDGKMLEVSYFEPREVRML